jgi:hypothetical protein
MYVKEVIQTKYPGQVDLDLVRTIEDFFEEAYGNDIQDHTSLRTMFNSNIGYSGLTLPCYPVGSGNDGGGGGGCNAGGSTATSGYLPQFQHRYFQEDLPCGILVQKGIAELAGVETPCIDQVIEWCQERLGKEYLVKGKLMGKDLKTTKTPQRYGYVDLDTFLRRNNYIV